MCKIWTRSDRLSNVYKSSCRYSTSPGGIMRGGDVFLCQLRPMTTETAFSKRKKPTNLSWVAQFRSPIERCGRETLHLVGQAELATTIFAV